MTDETKACGCPPRAVRCEHFANGSKVLLLDFANMLERIKHAFPHMEMTRFCIQYEPADGGNVCTGGGHTNDPALAEEEFAEYADHLHAHPEAGELAGSFVQEVRRHD